DGDGMEPVAAAIEAIENRVAHHRAVRDAERIRPEACGATPKGAALGAVDADLARPTDPADQPGGDHHPGPPAAPRRVVHEAAPDDGRAVGGIERSEPTPAQLLPVVVVDPGGTELGPGGPEDAPVPDERGGFEVDA